jgi:hypothetical protein
MRDGDLTKNLQSRDDIMDKTRAAVMKKERVLGCQPNLHPPSSWGDFMNCILSIFAEVYVVYKIQVRDIVTPKNCYCEA